MGAPPTARIERSKQPMRTRIAAIVKELRVRDRQAALRLLDEQ